MGQHERRRALCHCGQGGRYAGALARAARCLGARFPPSSHAARPIAIAPPARRPSGQSGQKGKEHAARCLPRLGQAGVPEKGVQRPTPLMTLVYSPERTLRRLTALVAGNFTDLGSRTCPWIPRRQAVADLTKTGAGQNHLAPALALSATASCWLRFKALPPAVTVTGALGRSVT